VSDRSCLLSRLTGREGEVMMVYKHKIEGRDQKVARSPRRSQVRTRVDSVKENDDDLDLTGSPLKVGLDQEWDISCDDTVREVTGVKNGPKYQGLALSDARGWLSKDRRGEQWVVTNGKDRENSVFLGSFTEGDFRSLSKVTWSGGPVSCRWLQQGGYQGMVARHLSAGGARGHKDTARAEYCLTAGDKEGSSLAVKSSWTKVTNLLETPPLDSTSCVLQARIVPGGDKLSATWAELQLLIGFVQGLTGTGHVTWLGEEEGAYLDEKMMELLETVRNQGPRSGVTRIEPDNTVAVGGEENDTGMYNLQTRQEVDFTDQLWLVLAKSQSYAELTSALTTILSTIQTEEIRPFIYGAGGQERSGLEVVSIVKSMDRGEIDLLDLSGSKPLAILVECGVEKLRRDYSHTLVTGELASKETVCSFLNGENVTDSVDQLIRLHRVVELASMSQTFLTLPPDTLRSVINLALQTEIDGRVMLGEDNQTVTYTFPLPCQAVAEQLSRVRPTSWEVRLVSAKVETVCLLLTEIPEEVIEEKVQKVDGEDDEEEKDPEYYMFILNQIKRMNIKIQG